MQAIILSGFGGPEVMQLAEVATPSPQADEILIRVEQTSVNRPDVIQRQGYYPPPPGASEILGLEVAGTVVETGTEAHRFQVGDRVMALVAGGGYAEYATAHESHVMPIPESVSVEQAACICETYITSYLNLFLLADGQRARSVLIHGGGGGIGTAAIQLCKALVPETTVIVTASSDKLERIVDLGADHVVDYREKDFAEEVRQTTDDRGVDVILDHIGAPYLECNMRSLAIGGTLLAIGVMGGPRAELNIARMMVQRQRIIGSVLRPRPVSEKAAIIAQFETNVLPLFADGTIYPVIHSRFALRDAAEAHRLMERSGHLGKIVLNVS